jgi:hypothetical protein
MGDGALVEFASAVDAVTCAIEVQKQVRERNADCPEDSRIQFRIGINVPGREDELPANSLQGPAVSRCDVIIRRWQQYTGKAARLAGSDLTFAEVEASRLTGQGSQARAEGSQ